MRRQQHERQGQLLRQRRDGELEPQQEAIYGERLVTREQGKAQVFDYIEVYYNRQRLHTTLGYLSPTEFELSRVA